MWKLASQFNGNELPLGTIWTDLRPSWQELHSNFIAITWINSDPPYARDTHTQVKQEMVADIAGGASCATHVLHAQNGC
jgi:hypothetical protein